MFKVRQASQNDFSQIVALYKKVAENTVGIARSAEEITDGYVQYFMENAADTGIELIIQHPDNRQIIAEIHCYKLQARVFSHVLSELTIVVDPDFHGRGLGKMLFTSLLDVVRSNKPQILRVELIARESNIKAIEFYERLGFKKEGVLQKRIRNNQNGFEADIPMAWFNPDYLSPG